MQGNAACRGGDPGGDVDECAADGGGDGFSERTAGEGAGGPGQVESDAGQDQPGCVGGEYAGGRSRKFVELLRHEGITGSMGRVGAAGDNAAMESFFALLQKNVLNKQRWRTREELRLEIVIWIERTYHRRRRQRGLGRLTPIEFETIKQTAHAA